MCTKDQGVRTVSGRNFCKSSMAILLMVVILWFPALTEAFCKKPHPGIDGGITVMTQNLYVGADILSVAEATSLGDIPVLVAATFNNMIMSDFQGRAKMVAARIAAEDPDLVGLQEVSLLRRQSPGDFMQGNPDPATEIVLDYLAILMDELRMLGLHYKVAVVAENADIEMPMFVGLENSAPQFDDVRLTDRDVILAKSSIKTWDVTRYSFRNIYMVSIGGLPIVFKRGFVAVTAKVRGETFRFVNAHLEVRENTVQVGEETAAIQLLQAEELTNELRREKLPLILTGDFNSSPLDPCGYAYSFIRDEGYFDVWNYRVTGNCEQGYTCCQAEDLLNEASLLVERIDHVFSKTRSGCVGPVFAYTVGDEPGDKTESGLWPSDHAGVVAVFRLP